MDGDLSKTITISINPSYENERDYCKIAIAEYTKKKNLTQDGDENEDYKQDERNNKKWFQLNIEKFAQCTISDAEDVGCDECGVRFYHNILMDSDKIFAPIQNDNEVVMVSKFIARIISGHTVH